MKRLAIIDLGSNTCRLVIFAFTPDGAFRLTDQVSESVRIGEGMLGQSNLQLKPMRRVIELLKMFAALCRANEIETVIATATSAVRDAANGAEFVERVARETGLTLRVLTGDEEAYYAYLGAINGVTLANGIIADLGGGSLELTRVQNRLLVATASLPLGAVRMTEKFLRGDPIPKSAVRSLTAYVNAQLDAFPWLRLTRGETLIALGGTVRALTKVDQRAREYPLERLHAYELSHAAVSEISDELLKKDVAARAKIKGLKDERADIIPAGALVIRELMTHVSAPQLIVSGRGLREGLLYEYLLREGEELVLRDEGSNVKTSNVILPDVRAFGIANVSCLYEIDWAHAQQVCQLALMLFDQMRGEHRLGAAERALLLYAACLHDCGVLIDYYRHHHHSAYLIENADLPGFNHRELAYLALLVRWHRRGEPTLEPYDALLTKTDLARLEKLIACLRMAEDLERSRAQLIVTLRVHVRAHDIEIVASTRAPAAAELWSANRETKLWDRAFGKRVRVVAQPHAEKVEPARQETSVQARAAWIVNALK